MAEAIYYCTIYLDNIKMYINKVNKDIITTRYLSNKISIVLCTNDMPDVKFDHFEMSVQKGRYNYGNQRSLCIKIEKYNL